MKENGSPSGTKIPDQDRKTSCLLNRLRQTCLYTGEAGRGERRRVRKERKKQLSFLNPRNLAAAKGNGTGKTP